MKYDFVIEDVDRYKVDTAFSLRPHKRDIKVYVYEAGTAKESHRAGGPCCKA